MDEEYDTYDLDEHCKDGEYLTYICHVQEDTEDIERKKRDDCSLDRLDNDFLKIMGDILEIVFFKRSQAEAKHEGQNKSCHDIHHRWY